MAGYGDQPMVPMRVPERIQLSAPNGGEGSAFSSQYHPMKVPDRIRLDDSQPQVPVSEANADFGHVVPARQLFGEQLVKKEPSSQPQQTEPVKALASEVAELSRQVQNLEQRIQQLEGKVATAGLDQSRQSGVGRVWYVLTFAGWMMVPLVAVFLFRFKRL